MGFQSFWKRSGSKFRCSIEPFLLKLMSIGSWGMENVSFFPIKTYLFYSAQLLHYINNNSTNFFHENVISQFILTLDKERYLQKFTCTFIFICVGKQEYINLSCLLKQNVCVVIFRLIYKNPNQLQNTFLFESL